MHALLASTTCWAFTPHTPSNNRLYVYSQFLSITPAHTLPRTLHGSQSLVRLLAERCSGRTLVFGWLTTSSTRGIQSPSSCTHSSRGQASCQSRRNERASSSQNDGGSRRQRPQAQLSLFGVPLPTLAAADSATVDGGVPGRGAMFGAAACTTVGCAPGRR